LRAKEVLAERKRRGWTNNNPRGSPNLQLAVWGNRLCALLHQTRVALMVYKSKSKAAERSSRDCRCFKCHQKGHLAKACPNTSMPKGSRRMTFERALEESRDANPDVTSEVEYEELWA